MSRTLPDVFTETTMLLNKTHEALRPAKPSDIWYQIPLAVLLVILRLGYEKVILKPMAKSLGVNDAKKKVEHNPVLEAAYRGSADLDQKMLPILAKRIKSTEREVQRWWRLRRSQDKPSNLTKFCSSAWKTTYMCCNFFVTLIVLWDKDWMWDVNLCFVDFRNQSITNDIWWYYMVNSAFVGSLFFKQFNKTGRKHFVVHHIITIVLLNSSWICNYYRIGTVVLVQHGCSKMFLEAAKAANTTKHEQLTKNLVLTFLILWTTTRLLIYPFHVLYPVTENVQRLTVDYTESFDLVVMMYVLIAIYFIWMWNITLVFANIVAKWDIRIILWSSNSEESDEDILNDTKDLKNQ